VSGKWSGTGWSSERRWRTWRKVEIVMPTHIQQVDDLSRELSNLQVALRFAADHDEWCQLYVRFTASLRAYLQLIDQDVVTATAA
jgi:hypothetical protein